MITRCPTPHTSLRTPQKSYRRPPKRFHDFHPVTHTAHAPQLQHVCERSCPGAGRRPRSAVRAPFAARPCTAQHHDSPHSLTQAGLCTGAVVVENSLVGALQSAVVVHSQFGANERAQRKEWIAPHSCRHCSVPSSSDGHVACSKRAKAESATQWRGVNHVNTLPPQL